MTPQEQIEQIYNETIIKLQKLKEERDNIIFSYIKELEARKVDIIKKSLK